jgi:hypothetical protein
MIRRAAHRRARVAAAVAAYPRWQPERHAVRTAHRVWVAASAVGEPLTFEAYRSAVDREERGRHVRQADEPRAASGGDRARASAGIDAGSPGGVVER